MSELLIYENHKVIGLDFKTAFILFFQRNKNRYENQNLLDRDYYVFLRSKGD